MTHVVKDYVELQGKSAADVDAIMRKMGVKSEIGAQTNGAWLVPGSLTKYGNVATGDIGITYFLEGRDVYMNLTYNKASGKITRAVQFAKAKNWVQRTGSVAELVVSAIAAYWTEGLSSALTKKIDQQNAANATYTSNNNTIAVFNAPLVQGPTGSQLDINGSAASPPASAPVQIPVTVPSVSTGNNLPAPPNGTLGSIWNIFQNPSTGQPNYLMIGLLLIGGAVIAKGI